MCCTITATQTPAATRPRASALAQPNVTPITEVITTMKPMGTMQHSAIATIIFRFTFITNFCVGYTKCIGTLYDLLK